MEEPGRIQSRLANVRSVEPVLAALHTISLSGWQAAARRSAESRRYAERLAALVPALSPHLPPEKRGPQAGRVTVAVVGSERGLCGRYNAAAVEAAEAHVDSLAGDGIDVEIVALGSRAARRLQRGGRPLAGSHALSTATLPPFDLAHGLARDWLARCERREMDGVGLVFNEYRGPGSYEPRVERLVPLPAGTALFPGRLSSTHNYSLHRVQTPPPAPPASGEGEFDLVIVETDPASLHARLVEQWTAVRLYTLLLDAAAAEHAARTTVLEAATQNVEALVADLTLRVQTARQQAITREMLELAAGAGMVGE